MKVIDTSSTHKLTFETSTFSISFVHSFLCSSFNLRFSVCTGAWMALVCSRNSSSLRRQTLTRQYKNSKRAMASKYGRAKSRLLFVGLSSSRGKSYGCTESGELFATVGRVYPTLRNKDEEVSSGSWPFNPWWEGPRMNPMCSFVIFFYWRSHYRF